MHFASYSDIAGEMENWLRWKNKLDQKDLE
jgi:hypothetical protein